MSRRSSGLTLIETVVACTLLGLATTVMASTFSYFTKSGLRYNQRQQMLTQGDHALNRVLSQIALTNSTSFYSTNGSSVGYPSSVQIWYFPLPQTTKQNSIHYDSTSGKPAWQSWDGFMWVPQTGVLSEGQQNCASTTSLSSLISPISTLTTWNIIPLASMVTGCSLTGPVSSVFTLTMTLTDSQGYQVQLSSSAQAQN
jgi:type II secretory pathway pseudopilin PulG